MHPGASGTSRALAVEGVSVAAWLTPTLRTPELTAQLRAWSGRSLVVAGDADPHFDREILAELKGRGDVTSVIVPGLTTRWRCLTNRWRASGS
ncbi:hypothetical protein WMF30_00650 [Sorangium sp. So ce134]